MMHSQSEVCPTLRRPSTQRDKRPDTLARGARLLVIASILLASCHLDKLLSSGNVNDGPNNVDPPGGNVEPVATRLAFDGQPSNTQTATAISPPLRVAAKDESGAIVPTFTGNITIEITTNPSGGVLSGTASRAAVAGVATFSGIEIDKPGTGYRLRATSGTLTNATSDGFNVTTAPVQPNTLSLSSGNGQTAVAGTALAAAYVVLLRNAAGQAVSGVTVSWAVVTGGGSIAATSMTNATGHASATHTLGSTVGAQRVTASVAGATGSPITFDVTATAPPVQPNTLSLLSGNAQTATAGTALPNPYVVLLRNPAGQGVAGVTVTWSLVTGGGSIAPTSVTNSSGQASATHTLGSTVGAQRVTASVTGATGSPITFDATATAVPPPPATRIALVSGNSQSDTISATLAQPYVVLVTNAANNPVAGVTVTWTVTGASNGGISPVSAQTDAQGRASASHRLGSVSGAHSVTASAQGLTGSPITFTATATHGKPAQLVFTQQPSNAERNKDIKPPVRVTVHDRAGNIATTATAAIVISIAPLTGTPFAQLSGDVTDPPSAGSATYNDLRINLAGTGYRLRATSAGLTVDSNPFNITLND